jgi:predicted DNA-binding transcriptional regulator YafY
VVDAAERLVNLALLMASAGEPVTAAQVRSRVAGYPEGQNETAFLRMFERDKEDLAAAGMVLVVDRRRRTGSTSVPRSPRVSRSARRRRCS